MNESYVFPEIQILLEGLGKMQTLNEVTPVINFITCVDLYSLNRISRGGREVVVYYYLLLLLIYLLIMRGLAVILGGKMSEIM